MAILTALGGNYATDRSQGPIGEASRAVGRIASAAGKKAEEEHLLSKCKASISYLLSECKALDSSLFSRTD